MSILIESATEKVLQFTMPLFCCKINKFIKFYGEISALYFSTRWHHILKPYFSCFKSHRIEHRIFKFSMIIEGATEIVTQFIMPPKFISTKNLYLNEQNVFFNTTEGLKQ